MPETFFISDTHFGHERIIHLSRRPFTSVEEMNEALIKNWNAVVGPKDVVWHLGDFGMGSDTPSREFAKRLNGKIHLIEGNHDQKTVRDCADCFASIGLMKMISIDTQKVLLCHYPMREWDKAWRGSWHLFGHVHGRLDNEPFSKSMDVGVDSNNYHPVSFEQVREYMDEQPTFAEFTGGELRAHKPWKEEN
ncbi:MAG: metallophosphoesterase family protein [Hyphomicrobiales bacterium]|uniref:metallophosphoesterase family protein n=1 Tax=Nisaea sp. TaxID=2024842 RepID=UPI00327F30A3